MLEVVDRMTSKVAPVTWARLGWAGLGQATEHPGEEKKTSHQNGLGLRRSLLIHSSSENGADSLEKREELNVGYLICRIPHMQDASYAYGEPVKVARRIFHRIHAEYLMDDS